MARQVADCTSEAERRGWPIAQQFIDNDVSATRGKPRPEYIQLLEGLKVGRIDAVIVWDIDRLTRTPSELETFIDLADRHGIALASIGGETDLAIPQGRLTERIKGNVGRHEVEQFSRRLKRKYQDLASEGKPHCVAPFGYRRERITDDKGRVTGSTDSVVPDESDAIRELYRRVIAGESLRSLAAYQTGLGFTTGRGNAWRGAGVRQMLLKPHYVGLRTHLGEVVGQGQWEPLVDQDTYDHA